MTLSLTPRSFMGRFQAYAAGKRLFKVMSLRRLVFASSLEQCQKRFTSHAPEPLSPEESALVMAFGVLVCPE